MAKLRPAGFLSSIASSFFPKQIVAEVRTAILGNGRVEVTPVYFLDNQEVPSELITLSRTQSILGYNAVLTRSALDVHSETQGHTIQLTKNKAADFLTQLEQRGIAVQTKGGKARPRVDKVQPNLKLELREDDTLEVQTEFSTLSGVVVTKPTSVEELRNDGGWYAVGDNLLQVPISNSSIEDKLFSNNEIKVFAGDDVPSLIQEIDENKALFGLIEKNSRLENISVSTVIGENRFLIDGDEQAISINPKLILRTKSGKEYEDKKANSLKPFVTKTTFRRVDEGWIEVDPEIERDYKKACKVIGDAVGTFTSITGPNIPAVLSIIKQTTIKESKARNPWSVYYSDAIESSHRVLDSPSSLICRMNLVESDGRSLLALNPIYKHERFELSHTEIQKLIQEGEEWVRRKNAWIKIDIEKQKTVEKKLRDLDLHAGPQGYEFTAAQREHVIEIFSVLGTVEHSEAYSLFLTKLADFTKIQDYSLPASIRQSISLREYQKHGFNWLVFLSQFGLNGILADDMGLGKTLQTLAAIQRAWESARTKRPSLIICPTSVVLNWQSEIKKFFSGCRPIIFTGNNRDRTLDHLIGSNSLNGECFENNLVITSFDVARIDHECLNRIEWLYVVVDEGHNIKNPDAKRTKAIKTINGQNKLVLTGTPIQNRLEELWSLFDFVMPGYLGSRSDFRNTYSRAGHVNWSAVWGGRKNLKERVHPFILRRLKENVAKDLPQKISISQKAELSKRQVSLYKEVLSSTDCRQMLEDVEKNGVKQAQMQILAAFTKLRTICNHPILTIKDAILSDAEVEHSGKLSLLQELMEEIIDGEHRTLVFCQSTQMLDIIQHWFGRWGIRCLRLDGSTPASARLGLVEEFNENKEYHAFLISTKAGGTGLNLTGADTVIFYDHDWNPANDNQAQDRAYRIGQTKPVTVYRLVCRGTIEEKILERQVVKQTLADQIVGSDEEGFKELTREELVSLFTFDESLD